MCQLPSELVIYVFNLACAEDTHDIVQRCHLAQVCAYWRSVALDYPMFWARIRIRTTQDAILLSAALAHSGDATLDVELHWKHRHKGTILSDAAQHAVIDTLTAPAQRQRLRRLYVEYNRVMQDTLFPLLGAGLDFPVLDNLGIQGVFGPQRSFLRLGATSVCNLMLADVNVDLWDTLITSSLEHLYLSTPVEGEAAALLTTILSRCTALRHLDWDLPSPTFVPGDAFVDQSGLLAPRLHSLRLGQYVSPFQVLRFINHHRARLDAIHDIAVTVYDGYHIGAEVSQLLPEVLRGTGSLQDLHVETGQRVVIQDDSGRTRRLSTWNQHHTWGISDLWTTLSTDYSAHKSLQSLRMRNLDWTGFAAGFSKRPPIALTVVHISLCGHLGYDIIDDEALGSAAESRPPRLLSIPSLRRLVFLLDGDTIEGPASSSVSVINRVREVLQNIDCDSDASGRVEVCISDAVLPCSEGLPTRETLLQGLSDKWDICPHCIGVC